MKTPKYYLVTLEWSHGFVSHSVTIGNQLQGELNAAKALTYVKNVTHHEIEKHEYDNFWIGKFNPNNLQSNPQSSSSDSERTSEEPSIPKDTKKPQSKPSGPKFSSLESFFDGTKEPQKVTPKVTPKVTTRKRK
jgi:hypothetical protein